MVFHRFHPFITVLVYMAIGLSKEYAFPVSSDRSYTFKPHHWQHPARNSVIDINGIKVDVFQWRAAAENRESVRVSIINPVWEFAGENIYDIVLSENCEISNVINFRGTPTVHIKINPWRTVDNGVEVLTQGEIIISIEPINVPITFSHPHLLNGPKGGLIREYSENTQYMIICPRHLNTAAQWLKNIYSDSITSDYRLNTEVVFIETIDSLSTKQNLNNAIRDYLMDKIDSSLEFILFLGDENNIPPLLYNNDFPSDDLYTLPDNKIGDPLITGRIPVGTLEDAMLVLKKISNYILHPTPGIWRSKIALVADDMYKSCSQNDGESSHTENSNDLFKLLNPLIPVLPYYGLHYNLQQTSSGCTYPDLTRDLIQTINNGVALINYIGHGSPETWSGEKIISKSRDLPLIHPSENKLAIWVAGTCSFGNYYGENSFMEDLLLQEDGAIAIIASTETVGYVENETYIDSLFSEIYRYISVDTLKTRLGELVWNAKNGDRKFHTFGDPALPLPFPKTGENLVNDDLLGEIHLIETKNISFNVSSQHSSILIRENENDLIYYFGSDSITYTVPGATYVQLDVPGNATCFRIPQDASSCNNCVVIQAYQENTDWNGRIETIRNVSLVGSAENFEDSEGPVIFLSQGNRALSDGSAIFPNMDLIISLGDESGINILETSIGHGIRYAFDNNNLVLVPGSEFIYTDCSTGYIKIPVPLSLSVGIHEFYLEAWDGLNNKSTKEMNLDLMSPRDDEQLHLSKVYPFPNPFSVDTHFTMYVSETGASITIAVYSLNGVKIWEANDVANENFFSMEWNGRDDMGNIISNGAYFYHVKAEIKGKKTFEDIYKLAKVE